MSENAPPPGTAGSAQGEARGTPYFEKLRRDLREALNKKRLLDESMAELEARIAQNEKTYLEETTAGNIVKGFDNYIKGTTGTGGGSIAGGSSTRRRAGISDSDRIFSRSSVSVTRAQDSPAPSSANTTPSHAPTPTSNGPNGRASNHPAPGSNGANKSNPKKKKAPEKDDDDDTETKSAKRPKISYGRD